MIEPTRDRALLASLLGRDPVRHAYELGDLAERYFADTRWWVARREAAPVAALLHYAAFDVGTVMGHADLPETADLWRHALPELPDAIWAHHRAVDAPVIAERYELTPRGTHWRMARRRVVPWSDARARVLTPADRPAARALYAEAMPDAHFDERTLDRGLATGVDGDGGLVAIASCHVLDPDHGVCALGAIATHPDARGRGYATATTAALVGIVESRAPLIVLNVQAANAPAVAVYRKLGFETAFAYEEARGQSR